MREWNRCPKCNISYGGHIDYCKECGKRVSPTPKQIKEAQNDTTTN